MSSDQKTNAVIPKRELTRQYSWRGNVCRRLLVILSLGLLMSAPLSVVSAAAPTAPSVRLAPSQASGKLVGATIVWLGSATGFANPVYQFSVAADHGAYNMVRDFSRSADFSWTPLHEGTYHIQAVVKSDFSARQLTRAVATFTVISRVKSTSAVVSHTANPLVALYSAPACSKGKLTVQFRAAASSTWQETVPQNCTSGQSVNVLVGGMTPNTRYVLRHIVANAKAKTTSSTSTFTSGKPPVGLKITPFIVKRAATARAAQSSSFIFHALIPVPSPSVANPLATDLSGRLVWYYDSLSSGLTNIWPVRILPGGSVLLLGLDRNHTSGDDVLREIDLAGNTMRETTVDAVNATLAQRGKEPIYMFHHDALRLPNGDTAVLGATQKKVSGRDVMSDMLVVLDRNFQVAWAWDMFDHFTPPTTWPAGVGTCSVLCALPDVKSVDWTHGNGIGWSAQDNNLILSFRNISLVIKIAFQNGQGKGNVVWRLGKGGDFSIKSTDPYPWFSLQHNATYVTPTTLVIFDDGNTRCNNGKAPGCQSRGQVYMLDEQHHIATLVVNAKLGSFWQALGSAQGLPNGNYFFAGGFSPPSREVEVGRDGSSQYELDSTAAVYRAYRLTGMLY